MINEELKKIAIERLAECQKNDDTESAHWDADDILRDLLVKLGYSEVIAQYDLVGKWYS
jgi:hypothetical protein